MTELPEQHIITMPFGASSYDGRQPNGLLFPDRHSIYFSIPGEYGNNIEDWLVINGRFDTLLPRFTTQETVLREAGVFQNGSDTVMLKAPVRDWGANVLLRGDDRNDYLLSRRKLSHVLGWDLATSRIQADPTIFPNPFEVPNPWTYTFIQSDGQAFHIDFAIARFAGNAPDIDTPSTTSTETQIIFSSDEPTFYQDEVEFNGNDLAQSTDAFIGLAYPSAGPFLFNGLPIPPNQFRYSGSARTPIKLEINDIAPSVGAPLYSLGIYNLTDFTFALFKHGDYPAGGWTIPVAVPPFKVVFDSDLEQFFFIDGAGTVTNLELDADAESDYNDFRLIPGKDYNFFVEYDASFVGSSLLSDLTFNPRFTGI